MKRRALRSVMLLTLGGAGFLGGCAKYPDPWENKGGPPRVLTSFPPIYCFAKNVGGAHAGLISLCTTTGPHHYQYNVRDRLYLKNADLFLANGLTLDEKFCDQLEKSSSRSELRYVKLGDLLEHKLLLHLGEEGRTHVHEDGTVCEHGEHDPHVWLGIPQAIAMVQRIREELKAVDEAHAADYDANAAAYIGQLQQLHADGKKLLADKKNRKLITFHESLGYFADPRTFNLQIAGVIMSGPGNEPSSPKLAQLVKLVTEQKVRVLAVEPQYPKTTAAHALLAELDRKGIKDVAMVEIDPLETASEAELTDPNWYVRKMYENLENLAKALQ